MSPSSDTTNWKRLIVGTTAALVIIAAMVFVVSRQWPSGAQPTFGSPASEGAVTVCQCAKCGHTFEQNTASLLEHNEIDPLEHTMLRGKARKCPKCGQYAAIVLEERTPTKE